MGLIVEWRDSIAAEELSVYEYEFVRSNLSYDYAIVCLPSNDDEVDVYNNRIRMHHEKRDYDEFAMIYFIRIVSDGCECWYTRYNNLNDLCWYNSGYKRYYVFESKHPEVAKIGDDIKIKLA